MSVIPAFYCCYLLRSPKKTAQPYVGSTPNILRRWKQHNGMMPGGAVQTSREGTRPWEVACIVHGFPSRSAALQFEWAWQHPHSTRRIAKDNRLSVGSGTKPLKRTPARLARKFAELHLLLRTSSFEHWPLAVTFFSEDAHRAWKLWDERSSNHLRPGIAITVDFRKDTLESRLVSPSKSPTKRIMYPIPVVLAEIDIKYSALKPHLEKSTTTIMSATRCSVCSALFDTRDLVAVCPHDKCSATSHLSCLSQCSSNLESFVPSEISCPLCNLSTPWISLMKELNLRTNSSLCEKILKRKDKKDPSLSDAELDLDDDDFWALQRGSESDDDYDNNDFIPIEDFAGDYMTASAQHHINEFIPIEDFGEEYIPTSAQHQRPPSPIIIPDSEDESNWDDVETLD